MVLASSILLDTQLPLAVGVGRRSERASTRARLRASIPAFRVTPAAPGLAAAGLVLATALAAGLAEGFGAVLAGLAARVLRLVSSLTWSANSCTGSARAKSIPGWATW